MFQKYKRVHILDQRPEHLRDDSSAISLDCDELGYVRTELGSEE